MARQDKVGGSSPVLTGGLDLEERQPLRCRDRARLVLVHASSIDIELVIIVSLFQCPLSSTPFCSPPGGFSFFQHAKWLHHRATPQTGLAFSDPPTDPITATLTLPHQSQMPAKVDIQYLSRDYFRLTIDLSAPRPPMRTSKRSTNPPLQLVVITITDPPSRSLAASLSSASSLSSSMTFPPPSLRRRRCSSSSGEC